MTDPFHPFQGCVLAAALRSREVTHLSLRGGLDALHARSPTPLGVMVCLQKKERDGPHFLWGWELSRPLLAPSPPLYLVTVTPVIWSTLCMVEGSRSLVGPLSFLLCPSGCGSAGAGPLCLLLLLSYRYGPGKRLAQASGLCGSSPLLSYSSLLLLPWVLGQRPS